MIYSPAEDSYLLEEEVRKFAKGLNVLEIGCGSGIQLRAASESGAVSVFGVDIDNESVAFCKKEGLNVVEGDLFEGVSGRFDLIIFNPPYLPEDSREDSESSRATSGGENGDEIIVRFLSEVKDYLSEKGVVLLVVSSLTPLEEIGDVLEKECLRKEILMKKKFFMESLEIWKLNRKT